MNKRAILILGMITLFFGTAYVTTKIGREEEANVPADEIIVSHEEENNIVNEETISTSVEEDKISPNAVLILKKHYTDCGHSITDTSEIPEEMVNLTESELKKKYSSWNIEKFSKEEIILSREANSFCGEHYLLIQEEGQVVIYNIDEQGNRNMKEATEIAYEFLPETDKIILNNGIYVYSTEELNKIKEDYES